jgi:hypothetical protein
MTPNLWGAPIKLSKLEFIHDKYQKAK